MMPPVAGRLPHKGTEIRRVLESLDARPMTAREVADMLGTDPTDAACRMVRQRAKGRVARIDQGPARGRGAVAVYALTEAARDALRIEQQEGRRVALRAA